MKQDTTRRTFLKTASLWAGALIFGGFFTKRVTLAASKEKSPPALPAGQITVPAGDPVATAIGYTANVKDIDYKKYPERKKPQAKSQLCKSCALYTASNDGWGKCSMLTTGLVAADGWCASWNKKS